MITIDPVTGSGTLIASLSSTTVNLRSLAFSPSGVLYGVVNIAGTLVTIDPSTGALTDVGPTNRPNFHGLEFTPDGTLYGWNNIITEGVSGLHTIDPATGDAIDVNPPEVGHGFAIDSLATAPDGSVLYGSDILSLVTIDRQTGTATALGPTGVGGPLTGLALVDIVVVPTASHFGLVLLGLLLAGAGWLALRRH